MLPSAFYPDAYDDTMLQSMGWLPASDTNRSNWWIDPTGTAVMPESSWYTEYGPVGSFAVENPSFEYWMGDVPQTLSTQDYLSQRFGGGQDFSNAKVMATNPLQGYEKPSSGWSEVPGVAKLIDAGLSIAVPAWGVVSGLAKVGAGIGNSNPGMSLAGLLQAGAGAYGAMPASAPPPDTSYASQFGSTNMQLGGSQPIFNTEALVVDQTLAPAGGAAALPSSPITYGGGNYMYGGEISPMITDPGVQAYGEALGAPAENTQPYVFGEGAQPFSPNVGLQQETAGNQFLFGGGERPFQVRSELDPNARPIETGLSVSSEWLRLAKMLSNSLAGDTTQGFAETSTVLPGASPDMSDFTTYLQGSGLGAGKSKGLGAGEALDTTVPLFYMPESEQKQGYGKGLYYS